MDALSNQRAAEALLLTPPGQPEVVVLATLNEGDFDRARVQIPDFADGDNYGGWLDDRYGWIIGLCSSGVDAHTVKIDLSNYLAWRRFVGSQPTPSGLDEFGAITRILRGASDRRRHLTVMATVSESEFAAYFDHLEIFQRSGGYRAWIVRRAAAMQSALASGRLVLRAPTPIGPFLGWAQCLGHRPSERLLDRYALLALEAFAGETQRRGRSAA